MTELLPPREAVLHYAQRLVPDGLTTGSSGNISARLGHQIAVTPRGVDYSGMTVDDVCVVDLDGRLVAGNFAPSGELLIHLALYEDPEVGAVVHTHSPYATVLSTTIQELPPIHYMVALLGGPVRVAPFAMPGSEALVASIKRGLAGRSAVLMQNHGALVTGRDLEQAYRNAINLEWLSALFYRASLVPGGGRILADDEYARAAERMSRYGRQSAAPEGMDHVIE